MRIDSDCAIEFAIPQGNKYQRDTYLQGTAAVLEAEVPRELVAVAKLNQVVPFEAIWACLFVDIAGAGDGHPFVFRIYSGATGDLVNPVSGFDNAIDPALLRFFFYDGAEGAALDAAAAEAKKRMYAEAAKLSALASVESVFVRQTGLCGGAQGKIVCGFMMLAITPVIPTIASAVLAGNVLTITGTGFESTLPNTQTYVSITGGTFIILSQKQILDAGGTITDTEIVVPDSLLPGVVIGDDVAVSANGLNATSAQVAIT